MRRDKLVTLQWSQSSEIMGGYSTPDSMLEIVRLMSTMKLLLLSFAVPSIHNTFGDRSFAVAGPRVWNILAALLRDEDMLKTVLGVNFKRIGFNVASKILSIDQKRTLLNRFAASRAEDMNN